MVGSLSSLLVRYKTNVLMVVVVVVEGYVLVIYLGYVGYVDYCSSHFHFHYCFHFHSHFHCYIHIHFHFHCSYCLDRNYWSANIGCLIDISKINYFYNPFWPNLFMNKNLIFIYTFNSSKPKLDHFS